MEFFVTHDRWRESLEMEEIDWFHVFPTVLTIGLLNTPMNITTTHNNWKTYFRIQFYGRDLLKARCTAETYLGWEAKQGSVTTEITLIAFVTTQKGASGVKVCRGSTRSWQVSCPVRDRPKGHRGIDHTATGKFGLNCDWGMTLLTCQIQ